MVLSVKDAQERFETDKKRVTVFGIAEFMLWLVAIFVSGILHDKSIMWVPVVFGLLVLGPICLKAWWDSKTLKHVSRPPHR